MANMVILYEDDELFAIDKPSGITVNKSETTLNQSTIQDWSEQVLQLDSDNDESDFYNRGGIVHRLDKETSGILLIAKNPESFQELQRQFKERLIEKTYLSLAHGKIVPETGEINVPVGRLPWNRKQFGIVSSGRESKTLYKVLRYYNDKKNKEILSYVELYPHSGRTHQIRVHLKYINHPVFADFLYAGRKTARKDRKILERVFLHAAKISFLHPVKKERVQIESKLPQELSNILSSLS